MDVGDKISAANSAWTFGNGISKEFDSHVEKSVPFYHASHKLAAQLSDFFLHDGSLVYDIGCSTGTLARLIAQRNAHKNIHIIAIDREKEMVGAARERCREFDNIEVLEQDVIDIDFERADLILSFYTIQFVRPKNRQILIDRIYNSLNWGGAFLLFEKVRGADARFQDIATALYNDFKLDKGYKPEEIFAKAQSLKGILEPFSTQGNLDLLRRAGFEDIMTIMKYVCFEGFLAIK